MPIRWQTAKQIFTTSSLCSSRMCYCIIGKACLRRSSSTYDEWSERPVEHDVEEVERQPRQREDDDDGDEERMRPLLLPQLFLPLLALVAGNGRRRRSRFQTPKKKRQRGKKQFIAAEGGRKKADKIDSTGDSANLIC